MSAYWNPWHGCHRVSEGCRNCYVFRIDEAHGKPCGEVAINADFLLPLKESRGTPKIEAGETVYTCFSSDFLIAEADEWRVDAWRMMRIREDLHFVFFTKRIERLREVLPPDWGDGYDNVTIGCTCENQDRADFRLPIFLSLLLTRVAFLLGGATAKLLCCEGEEKILGELASVYGYFLAVIACVFVMLVFSLTLFARCAAA